MHGLKLVSCADVIRVNYGHMHTDAHTIKKLQLQTSIMNMLKRKSDAADYVSHDFDQDIHNS
jgi:hypothetical protein